MSKNWFVFWVLCFFVSFLGVILVDILITYEQIPPSKTFFVLPLIGLLVSVSVLIRDTIEYL